MFRGSHQQADAATIKHRTPNTLCAQLTYPTLFPQSNPQPHYTLKSTKIMHSNYIGFVLIASMYDIRRPKNNQQCWLMALRYCNERPKQFQCEG